MFLWSPHVIQIADLHESITFYEKEVKTLIQSTPGHRSPTEAHKSNGSKAADDLTTPDDADEEGIISHTSDGEADEEIEERYAVLEEELTNIIADVHDLGKSAPPPLDTLALSPLRINTFQPT